MLWFMTESQIEKCRKRLEQFLVDLLEPVGRNERRHWGSVYIRGLLLDGERKSIEPLAASLPEGNVQALQQMVGQSPWPWVPVWERLAKRMTAELEPEPVWVIDETGFPKQGRHSPGVERQYSGTLGKTGNCQVAVSLHQAGKQRNTILGWRLYLPKSWTDDGERRAEAGIPAEVTFQEKWRLALELLDQVRAWGLPPRVVVADACYGEITEFRQGLEDRALAYVVGIGSQLGVWARPPRTRHLRAARTGRPPCTTETSGRWRSANWLRRPKSGSGSVGGKAPRDGCIRASRLGASSPRTASTKANRPIKKCGCWRNGRTEKRSRRNISSAIFLLLTRCGAWCTWPRAGGRSSRITSNSRRGWGWIITKGEPGRVGIITSLW